jgi:hypothetical protein
MANFTPCGVLTTLNDYQQEILSQLTRRFSALRRLAELLERAGDFTLILDDFVRIIPRLIPVEALDSLEAYTQIRNACPMLGLPEVNIDRAAELQTELARAYANLLRKIDLHQYNRMDQLQAKLDQFIGKAVNSVGRDWYICASTICDSTQNLSFGAVRNDIRKYLEIKSEIAEGRLPGNSRHPYSIVSEAGEQKMVQLKESRSQIATLARSEKAEIQAIITREKI